MIHVGDCVAVMAGMEPESVDAVCTDPPYGLDFMSQGWDAFAVPARRRVSAEMEGNGRRREQPRYMEMPRREKVAFQEWTETWATAALRVARPGAYLLAFGGTRTFHRLACAIEDAGWIIRDTLVWAYLSGFPKSRASLKPSWEPICLARKPGLLRPLDIEGCRIEGPMDGTWGARQVSSIGYGGTEPTDYRTEQPAGRWPPNVLMVEPVFDEDWPGIVGTGPGMSRVFLIPKASRGDREPLLPGTVPLSGGTSWDKPLRECNVCGSRTKPAGPGPVTWPACGHEDWAWVDPKPKARVNTHATVKPTELMRHLVRLVTPTLSEFVPDEERIRAYSTSLMDLGPDLLEELSPETRLDLARSRAREQGLGTWVRRDPVPVVLDPFLGSGTTALAAEQEGFAWIGIEREPEYVAIAEARLALVQRGLGLPA